MKCVKVFVFHTKQNIKKHLKKIQFNVYIRIRMINIKKLKIYIANKTAKLS